MRITAVALFTVILVGTTGLEAQAQDAAARPAGNDSTSGATADGPRGGQTDVATQANALYQAQNLVGALPLYEDLHKRHPKENLWRERLAMCLLSVPGSDAERKANRDRARGLLIEARDSGDNSNLVQVVLEKLDQIATMPAATGPVSPGMDALQRAEKAFSSGDLVGALKLYQEAMTADPKLYEAPLFAGDAEYKQGHYAEAGNWYAKAIAINPNRETAYRYWGDCLVKAGKSSGGERRSLSRRSSRSRTPRRRGLG